MLLSGGEQPTITDSWDDIFTAESNGTYNTKYSVGDTKELDLGTEGKVLMQIAAFDTDELASGQGNAKITWIARNCLPTKRAMNDTGNVAWINTDLRHYLALTLQNKLPFNSNKIQTVLKNSQYYPGGTRQISTTQNIIWIPSARELNLQMSSIENSGARYNLLFTNNASRSKGENYWIRTWISETRCYYVGLDGLCSSEVPTTELGVLIGFCT